MGEWLPTGIHAIDEHVILRKGEMAIIASRPGVGKTTLACKMINSLGIGKNYKIGVFSLELKSNCIARWILLKRAEKQDGEDYLNELSTITNNMVKIDDTPFINIAGISKRCHEWKNQMEGLDYIFIDDLTLIDVDGRYNNERHAFASRSLKELAKELNCVLVLLSPLSRKVDNICPELRSNQCFRPIRQDLRNIGVEQDADVELLLYSDEKYNQDTKNKGKLEIIIGKNRHGLADGIVLLDINKDLLK